MGAAQWGSRLPSGTVRHTCSRPRASPLCVWGVQSKCVPPGAQQWVGDGAGSVPEPHAWKVLEGGGPWPGWLPPRVQGERPLLPPPPAARGSHEPGPREEQKRRCSCSYAGPAPRPPALAQAEPEREQGRVCPGDKRACGRASQDGEDRRGSSGGLAGLRRTDEARLLVYFASQTVRRTHKLVFLQPSMWTACVGTGAYFRHEDGAPLVVPATAARLGLLAQSRRHSRDSGVQPGPGSLLGGMQRVPPSPLGPTAVQGAPGEDEVPPWAVNGPLGPQTSRTQTPNCCSVSADSFSPDPICTHTSHGAPPTAWSPSTSLPRPVPWGFLLPVAFLPEPFE